MPAEMTLLPRKVQSSTWLLAPPGPQTWMMPPPRTLSGLETSKATPWRRHLLAAPPTLAAQDQAGLEGRPTEVGGIEPVVVRVVKRRGIVIRAVGKDDVLVRSL